MRDLIRLARLIASVAALAALLQPALPASSQEMPECRRPADGRPVLLVGAADLGEAWCLEGRREADESLARYRNVADHPAPRVATFWAYLAPSREAVLEPLLVLLDLSLMLRADQGPGQTSPLDAAELEDGDRAVGLLYLAENGSSASVSYAFVVDRANTFVSLRGAPDALDELRTQGLRLARLQQAHLRAVVPGLPTRQPSAAAAGDCMRFVADLTIPDGTEVAPGQELEKVWRFANCGTTTWDGYRAVRTGGEYGPTAIAVPRTAPGATVDLVGHLKAPASPGRKRAYYQLEGPNGHFGGEFFIEVEVVDRNPPAVSPAPVQMPR